MSQEYYGNNGEQFPINTSWNRFLDQITLCLWDKMGIPRPLTKDDTLLISRVLRNYIKLQEMTAPENYYGSIMWSMFGFKQDDPEELKKAGKIAEFFERCDGLMTEEEWFDKFGKENDYDDM